MGKNDFDLLWGANAIGAALDISPRKAFYLLEKKVIPAKKVGGRWVASRSGLRNFFAEVLEGKGPSILDIPSHESSAVIGQTLPKPSITTSET